MRLLNSDIKLAKILSDYPVLVSVLERLNFRLGCGEDSLKETAKKYGVRPELLMLIFNLYISPEYPSIKSHEPNQNDLNPLINFLQCSHAFYTNEIYPFLSLKIDELIELHKTNTFKMLEQFYLEYKKEVDAHFEYEEKTVFPYIKTLQNPKTTSTNPQKFSVNIYQKHHSNINDKLNDIKLLLIAYLPEGDVNDTSLRRQIITQLSFLDDDLKIHEKIENYILIPIVKQLEP
ncbi:MAG: hemerythrin domain-containing protein [Bacteroidota bacterium]|nr:hemerythrin domain-containing protein [Bacteroidota bacterium]